MSNNGTSHFKQQRLTAMANVPMVMFLLWFIVSHLGAARADVVASVGNPVVAILLVATMISMLWHMWLGMQMVIEDYLINSSMFRIAMLANTVFAATMAVLSLYAIYKMSFAS